MNLKRIVISMVPFFLCACQAMPAAEQAMPAAEKADVNPLTQLTFNLSGAASTHPATYDMQAIVQKGPTEESSKYGSLTTSTKLDSSNTTFRDILTVTDQSENTSMVFDRMIVFGESNLFVPQSITIDLGAVRDSKALGRGRIFDYENGVAKYVEEDRSSGTEHLDFTKGILTFNALLRLTPLLPRNIGNVYTFRASDEEFLFHIHTANAADAAFTLTCESLETITLGPRSYNCVKFVMEQKSPSSPYQSKMELWVDTTHDVVVKFSQELPADADAKRIEATLKE